LISARDHGDTGDHSKRWKPRSVIRHRQIRASSQSPQIDPDVQPLTQLK
jgi:hypothetical protein